MRVLLFLSFTILFLQFNCSQNTPKNLDGMSFQVRTWEMGKPDKKDPDVIRFSNGSFDSEGCHQYGFMAAPYKSEIKEGKLSFTGKTTSSTEGEMEFTGMVNGNAINGSFVWRKAGQADIHYVYEGERK